MKKMKFNINERPKTEAEKVVYLVDKENVDIMRQYVGKYYPGYQAGIESWSKWFENIIAYKIMQHPSNSYYIYFENEQSLCWDEGYIDVAEQYGYETYYIEPPVLLMEFE